MMRILTLAFLFMGALLQGAPTFTLIPSSQLFAPANSIAGWGFDITADGQFAVSIISTSVVDPSDPAFGTYTDLVSLIGGPDAGYLLPGPHWIQPFHCDANPLLQTGLGFVQVAPNAQGLFTALVHIDYEVYAVDGELPGEFQSTDSVELPISITVVPEPASWMLVVPFLMAGLLRMRLRSSRRG